MNGQKRHVIVLAVLAGMVFGAGGALLASRDAGSAKQDPSKLAPPERKQREAPMEAKIVRGDRPPKDPKVEPAKNARGTRKAKDQPGNHRRRPKGRKAVDVKKDRIGDAA